MHSIYHEPISLDKANILLLNKSKIFAYLSYSRKPQIYINVNVIVIFVISENHAGIMSSGRSRIFISGCADSQSGCANPLLCIFFC